MGAGHLTGAHVAVQAIAALRAGDWTVSAMQDVFPDSARPRTEPRVMEAPWLEPVLPEA